MATLRPCCAALISSLVAAGGCTPANLPSLPTGSAPTAPGATNVTETSTIVQGTPTEVYALVARGALRCWFGADGPLRSSHIFHAEATPPSQGGAAEIALHERDPTAPDPRGIRAYRITFASAAVGVQVGIANLKIASPLAELMADDVKVWAGGGKSCEARKLNPPPPNPSARPPTTRGGVARSGQR